MNFRRLAMVFALLQGLAANSAQLRRSWWRLPLICSLSCRTLLSDYQKETEKT
jgi:hypothetical protein